MIIITGESFPLSLQKLLKWKLSSITPIVVRQTIQNSGFKLVRSEHSLDQNSNDPSIITNQSNLNTISLQNHYGVTPPIVDAFCGVAPPPNELMMLPQSRECTCTYFLLLYIRSIMLLIFIWLLLYTYITYR